MHSPALLLVVTGFFLGLTFPLGKLATAASVPPLVWACWLSGGSALCLVAIRGFARKRVRVQPPFARYYLLSAVVSLVLPNTLIFIVVDKLGAGFTSIFFTLSPIFTLILSSIVQVRVPNALGIAGVITGFLGAIVVAWTRGEAAQPAAWLWVFAGLCIPVSLAVGNVYRTVAWPAGGEPLELAAGSNAAAAVMLVLAAVTVDGLGAFTRVFDLPWLALAQVAASTAMFTTFFRLQLAGGPTYLSQIGYVAAAVALLIGTFVLGERYAPLTWLGAGIIFTGVGFSIASTRTVAEDTPR
ncbi:MAG: DMT family transporter [Pseudomonadota bacterium]